MQQHWLTRPATIRVLWAIFIAVLAVTVALQLGIHVEGHFGVDGSFGFNAWYGFGTCAVMIVFAKLLGFVLKRRDTYYEGGDE